jgi:hypothetical protein
LRRVDIATLEDVRPSVAPNQHRLHSRLRPSSPSRRLVGARQFLGEILEVLASVFNEAPPLQSVKFPASKKFLVGGNDGQGRPARIDQIERGRRSNM